MRQWICNLILHYWITINEVRWYWAAKKSLNLPKVDGVFSANVSTKEGYWLIKGNIAAETWPKLAENWLNNINLKWKNTK